MDILSLALLSAMLPAACASYPPHPSFRDGYTINDVCVDTEPDVVPFITSPIAEEIAAEISENCYDILAIEGAADVIHCCDAQVDIHTPNNPFAFVSDTDCVSQWWDERSCGTSSGADARIESAFLTETEQHSSVFYDFQSLDLAPRRCSRSIVVSLAEQLQFADIQIDGLPVKNGAEKSGIRYVDRFASLQPLQSPRDQLGTTSRCQSSKNSGYVFAVQPGSRITTPACRKPATAKLIAMRWSL